MGTEGGSNSLLSLKQASQYKRDFVRVSGGEYVFVFISSELPRVRNVIKQSIALAEFQKMYTNRRMDEEEERRKEYQRILVRPSLQLEPV